MRYLNPSEQSAAPSQHGAPIRRAAQTEIQGDIVQFAQQRGRHVKSVLHDWLGPGGDDVPTTRMANRSGRIKAAGVPQLFLPLNRNRNYYIVSNQTGAVISLTFGFPTGPSGIAINNNQNFQQMGPTCATDEIYITGTAAGAFISCYEGVPVVDDAKRER